VRRFLWVFILAAAVVLMAWLRVFISGHQARQTADRLVDQNRADEAVGYYDRVLHMYWPGSPDVARAVAQLEKIAAHAEQREDLSGAIHAFRILRSGLYASRSLYQPYPEIITMTEQKIVALSVKMGNPDPPAQYLALLQKNQDPARSWSMIALLGFALWIGSTLAFLWRAVTPEGRLLPRPALCWGLAFAAGYGLWLAGLALA